MSAASCSVDCPPFLAHRLGQRTLTISGSPLSAASCLSQSTRLVCAPLASSWASVLFCREVQWCMTSVLVHYLARSLSTISVCPLFAASRSAVPEIPSISAPLARSSLRISVCVFDATNPSGLCSEMSASSISVYPLDAASCNGVCQSSPAPSGLAPLAKRVSVNSARSVPAASCCGHCPQLSVTSIYAPQTICVMTISGAHSTPAAEEVADPRYPPSGCASLARGMLTISVFQVFVAC